MRLGFYTPYSKDTAEFAREVGFTSLELSAWLGTTLDADKVTDKEIAEITFVGRDPSKTVAENLPLFKELFSRFCDEAERRGLRIAIENCPMQDRKTLQGTNIAYSREIWAAMFDGWR